MNQGFVCLMYHEVAPAPSEGGAAAFFAVTRDAFRRHLDFISAERIMGCSIANALASPGQRRIAISFDDGTVGHFEFALPELMARGMTATFFITTSWVGRPGYANWQQLNAMRASGMEIGSHTATHPFLSELSVEEVRAELVQSRSELDDALGQRTVSLAFPGGDGPRRRAQATIGEVGYSTVATSRWGINYDGDRPGPRFIRRCTVHGRLADATFRRMILGDQLLGVQRAARELVLGSARRAIGPSRYAAMRRRFLDRLSAIRPS